MGEEVQMRMQTEFVRLMTQLKPVAIATAAVAGLSWAKPSSKTTLVIQCGQCCSAPPNTASRFRNVAGRLEIRGPGELKQHSVPIGPARVPAIRP
jgi:hypothetical protein